MSQQPWDLLIRNALVFDGGGAAPVQQDLAVADGKIASLGAGLDPANAVEVVDATGQWLTPGLLDIHTHLDLEVEVNPGLGEAVRHGSTTVVVGNCSLGTSFGPQLRNGESPIIDCFTRVENMPKRVLEKCIAKMHWDNTGDYLKHFDELPLGPNIAPLLPHSMLRVEVMGVDAAINGQPTEEQRAEMERLLQQALDQGYIGLSTDGIVFHYMANDPNKEKYIPSMYADKRELKSLIKLLREHNRVWQTTPNSQKMADTLKTFFWSCGYFFRKPLRVSALTALDFNPMPKIYKSMLMLAGVINSWLFNGRFHFQALPTNFRMWGNGIQMPVFEELDSTRALIACEVDDPAARQELLDDPQWQAQWHRDWNSVKPGTTANQKRGEDSTFELVPEQTWIDDNFVLPAWRGQSLAEVHERFKRHLQTGTAALDDAEREVFENAHAGCEDLAEFFIHCMRTFDLDFRWWVDVANCRKEVVKEILFHKHTLPGFNDSGAHISNLAFYDGNLMTLKLAQEDGLEQVATAVKRLTRDPAEFFGLDVGTLQIGAQADLVLVNPETLKNYDTNANRQMVYHPEYEQDVMVNRSDGVVEQVYINGVRVWEAASRYTEALGSQKLGRALTHTPRNTRAA